MAGRASNAESSSASTRRRFLKRVGQGAVTGGVASSLLGQGGLTAKEPSEGKVAHRTLGKTGLDVSEIGFGGHSWAYKKVPTREGGYRKVNIDEAVEMISAGMDMGVNFFDSCTPLEESSTPGEALKRLKARDRAIVSIRVSHKCKGGHLKN